MQRFSFIFILLIILVIRLTNIEVIELDNQIHGDKILIGYFDNYLNNRNSHVSGPFNILGYLDKKQCTITKSQIYVFVDHYIDVLRSKTYKINGSVKKGNAGSLSINARSIDEYRFHENWLLVITEKIRFEITRVINIGMSGNSAGLAVGYLVGGSNNLSNDIVSDFRKLSLSHILAVSGYNITIVSLISFSVLNNVFSRRRAGLLSGIIIIIFCFVAGLSASVVRAGLMGLVVILATSFGRVIDPFRSLVMAGLLMAIYSPNIIKDIGFQLSFLAVVGLLFIQPFLADKMVRINKFGLGDSLATTVSAQIMVTPLISYYFGNVSLLGILANLLITPLIPYAMLFSSIAIPFSLINSWLGILVSLPATLITKYQMVVSSLLADISFSSVDIRVNLLFLFIIYICLIFFMVRLRNEKVL